MEGARLEESGEIDAALVAYQKVLTVDPGEVELASRVASLLTRQEDFPRAVDVLKDAIKADPKDIKPYLQLAFIYAKHLQKPEQAIKYSNQAIALEPEDLDAYQRIYEIERDRYRNVGDSQGSGGRDLDLRPFSRCRTRADGGRHRHGNAHLGVGHDGSRLERER